MKECNYSTFELCPSAGVDGGRTERLPDDGLTDVGGNKERDTGAKTVPLLKEFVQQQYNQTSTEKLRGGWEEEGEGGLGGGG